MWSTQSITESTAFIPLQERHILDFLNCNVCSQLDKCKMKHKYLLVI